MNFDEFSSLPDRLSFDQDFVISRHQTGRITFTVGSEKFIGLSVQYVSPLLAVDLLSVKDSLMEVAILNNRMVEPIQLSQLPWPDALAYLSTVHHTEFNGPGVHVPPVLIVSETVFVTYKQKFHGSVNWSGFILSDDPMSSLVVPSTNKITEIRQRDKLRPEHRSLSSVLATSVTQVYPSLVFLTRYHLVELMLDKSIVDEIKALDEDLHGIGKTLKRLSGDEYERLQKYIVPNLRNLPGIEDVLRVLVEWPNWIDRFLEMAFEFDKKSNPIGSHQVEFEEFLLNGVFDRHSWNRARLPSTYEEIVKRLSCYIFYRLRCSVAHRKIGEYLLEDDDEKMYLELGLPLANVMLEQVIGT